MKRIVKDFGRAIFRKFPSLGKTFHKFKWAIITGIWNVQNHRYITIFYSFNDALHVYKFMKWSKNSVDYWELSAKLLFQYHKLEKGLCMPGPKRFFGLQAIQETLKLLDVWISAGLPTTDPVYVGAIETLRSYKERLYITPPPENDLFNSLLIKIDHFVDAQAPYRDLTTPIQNSTNQSVTYSDLHLLCLSRRSVRSFSNSPVNIQDIHSAIKTAQLSPSACNRQPWNVHIYSKRESIDAMLKLQNGNQGFGHTIPLLLVLTANSKVFFDGSERHEPFIDLGLFTMTLLLALKTKGLGTCCLNWCVSPAKDDLAHKVGNIPLSEKIVMYLAVGEPDEHSLVPRSARRDVDSFLIEH